MPALPFPARAAIRRPRSPLRGLLWFVLAYLVGEVLLGEFLFHAGVGRLRVGAPELRIARWTQMTAALSLNNFVAALFLAFCARALRRTLGMPKRLSWPGATTLRAVLGVFGVVIGVKLIVINSVWNAWALGLSGPLQALCMGLFLVVLVGYQAPWQLSDGLRGLNVLHELWRAPRHPLGALPADGIVYTEGRALADPDGEPTAHLYWFQVQDLLADKEKVMAHPFVLSTPGAPRVPVDVAGAQVVAEANESQGQAHIAIGEPVQIIGRVSGGGSAYRDGGQRLGPVSSGGRLYVFRDRGRLMRRIGVATAVEALSGGLLLLCAGSLLLFWTYAGALTQLGR